MTIDAVTLGVMANRLDGVTREMTHTMVRAARSTTMAARDFSCSLTTSDHELISCPEGMPVHVFGSSLIAASMADLHPEFREGDAFLHNDPYLGNSHAADHTILVPVFFDDEHVFTACAKAHQADCGNALPTTYSPTARDVYEEGALIFPCVLVQRDYVDQMDIIRMCERRIRSFETWYGDYLATLGAARVAERRLREFCAEFSVKTVREFVSQWMDYSERVAADAIARLPRGRVVAATTLDPFPGLPDGIPLKATVDVDPEARRVAVDLRDNPDCTPTGLNLTESTARNSATTAVLMALNSHRDDKQAVVPNNSGAYRRIDVLVRENCVVGIPRHPASASVATNTVTDRAVGMIMCAFAQLGEGFGTGEPCYGSPPFEGVVSGADRRRDGAPYVFQIFCGTSGGPGLPMGDGWLAFHKTGDAGLGYIDSSEVVEQKYPIVVWEKVVRIDSEGAGRWRGAPGAVSIFGPRFDPMRSQYFLDGAVNRPTGARLGGPPLGPEAWLVQDDGCWMLRTETVGEVSVGPGECIVSLSCGGAGYGDQLERDPAAVLEDVIEGYVSADRARAAYGVVLQGELDRWETVSVDAPGTVELRARLRNARPAEDAGRAARREASWWLTSS